MPFSTTFQANKPARPSSLAVTAAITILITVIMTVLSIFFGGFGSTDAMASEVRGFSLPIIIHLTTAVPALLVGPVVLWRRKGNNLHRWLGRAWIGLMLVTAIASAFIHSPGAGIAGTGYSFIHIFTIWTLTNVPLGVWFARSGRIEAHRSAMAGLYVGLVIAGLATLTPGRLLGNLVFG
ncbi:DUF2306 domain-containing protein [Croceicoccus sp. F390]|uniref:DUF2306 domain-containing protein n=1 Tax=Croceicoccus esteveae TaxID=3075597 RepID=A0ABU2ZGN4_9SPHN|nr:DUF2306 domain-containing protein [Croceicoccus sp. F390]MDT0575750.1 DUF2306 domain-containing protein [Croceicoccus sp. F390]